MKRLAPILVLAAAALSAACDKNDDKTSPTMTMPVNAPPTPTVTMPAYASPSADNTRVNARDDASALTPMDQGNDAMDLKITQSIRKALMSDSALSMDAKNCKVIASGGKVVLRGPVTSTAERTDIESRARATPGVTGVDDELEVKTP